ncbi:OmpA family protein [Thiothrix fructosivorans]|jgi:outer membrane protein OmpA-like peptidoglycan-associated protein|uniref:OmpA family protein n=1 Tax=Thiothrix fructosivorans TaxID=111770 RepID=A0A8B0SFE5_9GAMM|nr:OmpA family protein [Thiothrix fructosivorans]MBO0611537.1 OmpA family protein [Thiothrix fructosivorans]QTX10793.1 OmpA family protein [Thiothrix fructosivorans]
MKISMRTLLIGTVSAALMAGCSPTGEMTRAQQGALIGAIGGAVVGKNTGDKDKGHTIAGAVVGGLAGAAIGNYMDQQEAALRQNMQGTGVEVTRQDNNIVLTMPDAITFDTAQAGVKPQFYGVLNNLASTLNQFPETRVQIAGHTDNVGSDASNLQLSQQRANSVRTYLASTGVAAQRMQAVGYGESRPIADNSSDYGRAQNRRVEVTLIPVQM